MNMILVKHMATLEKWLQKRGISYSYAAIGQAYFDDVDPVRFPALKIVFDAYTGENAYHSEEVQARIRPYPNIYRELTYNGTVAHGTIYIACTEDYLEYKAYHKAVEECSKECAHVAHLHYAGLKPCESLNDTLKDIMARYAEAYKHGDYTVEE